jgi:hypothetical protein
MAMQYQVIPYMGKLTPSIGTATPSMHSNILYRHSKTIYSIETLYRQSNILDV